MGFNAKDAKRNAKVAKTLEKDTMFRFDPQTNAAVITSPTPPSPWINYLTNRRLTAFISQNAGGLMWYKEPQSRRISRYHYMAAPSDRPGFYVYLRDAKDGTLWNPHYAPVCTPLDSFECQHLPGRTRFVSTKNGIASDVTYFIPPDDDVMLTRITIANQRNESAILDSYSYLEFSFLEYMREQWWCYIKAHFGVEFDKTLGAIKYDYHAFEAPFTPAMLFGSTPGPIDWECSRDAFIGQSGSYSAPEAITTGRPLSNSNLPLGGQACATLHHRHVLEPGQSTTFSYVFAIHDTWDGAAALLNKHRAPGAIDKALAETATFWSQRLERLTLQSGDRDLDAMINCWNPVNTLVSLQLARIISTDHTGADGLRYRDTTQDALAVANIDPDYSLARMRLVFQRQKKNGAGCFSFFPDSKEQHIYDKPERSDNTVWPIYTIRNLIAETGNEAILDEVIPYRDGGEATIYEHILIGLKYITQQMGPHGLPLYLDADWNDGLALFQDRKAESIMLGMQLVYSCNLFREIAEHRGNNADAEWCSRTAAELTKALNSDASWDGAWYRRLLLSNGKLTGSSLNRQGRIYLEPQGWSVISGVGMFDGRGLKAMMSVGELLDSKHGIRVVDPPFRGFPEPEDPPLGSNPGVNENGAIFNHANTWAIIAEALLGHSEQAWKYYRQLLPPVTARDVGYAHYRREPYVYVSSIVGPVNSRFGEGGISWLSGTASWMYIAFTQYILGIQPTLAGLVISPSMPAALPEVHVTRLFRGTTYKITLKRTGRPTPLLTVDGKPHQGPILSSSATCNIRFEY